MSQQIPVCCLARRPAYQISSRGGTAYETPEPAPMKSIEGQFFRCFELDVARRTGLDPVRRNPAAGRPLSVFLRIGAQ